MGAGHGHDHLNESTKRSTLLLVLGLTSTFMGVEAIAGWVTGSLALLADAGHMLADVAALSLSMFAMWMATKKSPADKTYGYHRVEILAAAINAVVLLLLVCFIFYEAFLRFSHPSSVVGLPVLIVGTVGLGVNLLSLRLLTGKSTASLNVRSAYLEVLSDAVAHLILIDRGDANPTARPGSHASRVRLTPARQWPSREQHSPNTPTNHGRRAGYPDRHRRPEWISRVLTPWNHDCGCLRLLTTPRARSGPTLPAHTPFPLRRPFLSDEPRLLEDVLPRHTASATPARLKRWRSRARQ